MVLKLANTEMSRWLIIYADGHDRIMRQYYFRDYLYTCIWHFYNYCKWVNSSECYFNVFLYQLLHCNMSKTSYQNLSLDISKELLITPWYILALTNISCDCVQNLIIHVQYINKDVKCTFKLVYLMKQSQINDLHSLYPV